MKTRLAILLCMAAAVFAAATVSAANAAVTSFTCSYPTGGPYYKYSGIYRFTSSGPTGVTGGLVQHQDGWAMGAGVGHIAWWNGLLNETTGFWVQTGIIEGYDPFSNKISSNYPLGNWNYNTHPWDGHPGGNRGNLGNGPMYTPTATFSQLAYAESYTGTAPTQYQFQGLSFITGTGTWGSQIRNDSGTTYSMIYQGNVIGGVGSSVYMKNLGAGTAWADELVQEYATSTSGPQPTTCGDTEGMASSFQTGEGTTSYYPSYLGCNDRLENITDPNCDGGATSAYAPLDNGLYCEVPGCITGQPPFTNVAAWAYEGTGLSSKPPFNSTLALLLGTPTSTHPYGLSPASRSTFLPPRPATVSSHGKSSFGSVQSFTVPFVK